MVYLIRFIIDIVYIIALYCGYEMGQAVGMKYMFTDLYVAHLYCGFIGICVVVAVFSILKTTIFFFLKASCLYAYATDTSISDAVKGCLKNFRKLISVAAVTKLITEAVQDVKIAMLDGDANTSVTKLIPILNDLPFASIVNAAGRYYAKSFTYLDECILAYSFALDKPLLESIKEAFVQFLKKSSGIMTKLVVANAATSFVNVTVFIIGLFITFKRVQFSLPAIAIFYIIARAVMYVIDDAFVQPLLLKKVIQGYIDGISTVSESFMEDVEKLNSSATDSDTEMNGSAAGETTDSESGGISGSQNDEIANEIGRFFELPAVKRLINMEKI